MTKHKRGRFGPDMSDPWGTTKSLTTVTWTSTNGGTPAQSNQSRAWKGKWRVEPIAISRTGSDGYRPPTAFRSYACRYLSQGGFDYTGHLSTGQKVRHWGSSGFPPNQTDHGIYLGTSGSGHFPNTSLNQQNQTLTECLNKVKDSDMNIAESIATLDQTLSMLSTAVTLALSMVKTCRTAGFSGLANNAKGLISSTKKAPYRNMKSLADTSGNYWLEYQYGWRPLMMDIRGLIDLAQYQRRKCLFLTAIRHTQRDRGLPGPQLSGTYGYQVDGRNTDGCYVRLDVAIQDERLYLLDQLGLMNPFLLAWELTPYSFVLDWLIPIGNCLQALTASLGIYFRGGSMTTYTKVNLTMKHGIFLDPVGSLITARIESLATQRVVYNTMPLPRLYIKSPFTSLTRLSSALALALQAL